MYFTTVGNQSGKNDEYSKNGFIKWTGGDWYVPTVTEENFEIQEDYNKDNKGYSKQTMALIAISILALLIIFYFWYKSNKSGDSNLSNNS
uniref:Uncharacterized protein n=1 Tax=viral metagenome TaxID=1070528 RepID=A0A6C0KCF8_9ZZZZ